MLQTGNRWSSQMLDFSERLGAHTSMLVDADGDYAHEFWEENKAFRPTVGPKKQPSCLETSHEDTWETSEKNQNDMFFLGWF